MHELTERDRAGALPRSPSRPTKYTTIHTTTFMTIQNPLRFFLAAFVTRYQFASAATTNKTSVSLFHAQSSTITFAPAMWIDYQLRVELAIVILLVLCLQPT